MQLMLPLIPSGATRINEILSCTRENGTLNYFLSTVCISSHAEEDTCSFKHKICELISSGTCRNRDILQAFGLSSTNLKRWLRAYNEKGANVFYRHPGTRGGTVLTAEVLIYAQGLFDQGLSRKAVSEELSVSYDTIRKAVRDGRLHISELPERSGQTRTERSIADAESDLGVACVRTTDRILAAVGAINSAETRFEENYDIENAGVLCALPALTENGLYRHLSEKFTLPGGYYGIIHIVSLLAFMVLFGIPIIERLRFESPGEMGKLLGLDRIPEVRTLREKLSSLCVNHESVAEWSRQLTKDWFDARPDLTGVLYIDGHVSTYYGDKTKLPRRYCSRFRLCMRGSSFYYINDILGQPFFFVEQVIDEGLLKTLRNIIIPRLLELVPNQPSDEELENNPQQCRFIIIFDREGYSPAFFKEMWEHHRIGCITYHKYPKEDWPQEKFTEIKTIGINGETQKMNLAERLVSIGDGNDNIPVKEVRRLTESGHQTSIISTVFNITMDQTAIYMFNRWVQENFFKYMIYLYDIDSLMEYGTEAFSGPLKVVNPSWKTLDYKINSARQKLSSRLSKFGKIELPSNQNNCDTEKKIKEKAELLIEIEQFKSEVEVLTEERKKHSKHILFDELPDELKFERLKPSKRLFFDTIKMLVYRSETAMTNIIKPFLGRDDSRVLIRQLMKSHADILPDNKNNVLNVHIHRFTTRRHDQAIRNLLQTLNETETSYPGTNMKLVYSLIEKNESLL